MDDADLEIPIGTECRITVHPVLAIGGYWAFGIIFPGYLADVIECEGLEPMLHFKNRHQDMEFWCTEADLTQVELHDAG